MARTDDRCGFNRGGWRFSWRPDRLQKLHDLGRSFDLTEDSQLPVAQSNGEPDDPTKAFESIDGAESR
jgi:hypothetical protein